MSNHYELGGVDGPAELPPHRSIVRPTRPLIGENAQAGSYESWLATDIRRTFARAEAGEIPKAPPIDISDEDEHSRALAGPDYDPFWWHYVPECIAVGVLVGVVVYGIWFQ